MCWFACPSHGKASGGAGMRDLNALFHFYNFLHNAQTLVACSSQAQPPRLATVGRGAFLLYLFLKKIPKGCWSACRGNVNTFRPFMVFEREAPVRAWCLQGWKQEGMIGACVSSLDQRCWWLRKGWWRQTEVVRFGIYSADRLAGFIEALGIRCERREWEWLQHFYPDDSKFGAVFNWAVMVNFIRLLDWAKGCPMSG